VKFAGEAETATIYTADALRGELTRLTGRSRYHSVAIVGRDALAEEEFLLAAFTQSGQAGAALPVMLDHDGQRPASLEPLLPALGMVQVTMDGTEGAAALERVCSTIAMTAKKHVAQAVAIIPGDALSDAPLLRIVEQIHEASGETQIVVHPVAERAAEHDRRWTLWLEQAMALHSDVRVLPRWPQVARR
jgi:pyruvate-formate lyase-activating enzyme